MSKGLQLIIRIITLSKSLFLLQVDIVVGTPGRLEDLISTGKLALSCCRFFVLDEAVSINRLESKGHEFSLNIY